MSIFPGKRLLFCLHGFIFIFTGNDKNQFQLTFLQNKSYLAIVHRKVHLPASSMHCPLLSPTVLNGFAYSHQILRFNDLCFRIICVLTSVSPLPPHLPLCGQCGSALSNEPLCHRADLLKSTYFSSYQSMSSHTSILAFVPSRLPYLMSCLFAFTGNQGSRPHQHSVSGLRARQWRGDWVMSNGHLFPGFALTAAGELGGAKPSDLELHRSEGWAFSMKSLHLWNSLSKAIDLDGLK